jgi:hypothetical protein
MGLLGGTEQLESAIMLVLAKAAVEQHQPQPGVEGAH